MRFYKKLITVFVTIIFLFPAAVFAQGLGQHPGYTLEKVVILSRHNIRAPLSSKDSLISSVTPHSWIEWTSAASELSSKGAVLETLMGIYFKKYLASENFMSENYQPEDGEFLFYANSLQRTVATAQYFSSGLLPVANARVIHHLPLGNMDHPFTPSLRFCSEKFKEKVHEELDSIGGLEGLEKQYQDNLKVLERVLDYKDSESYLSGKRVFEEPTVMKMVADDEPSLSGTLKNANTAADAFVLQYYEQDDLNRALFGHSELTYEDVEKIGALTDVYNKILFGTPSLALNESHSTLLELYAQLLNKETRFTFLCGHDSTIESTLAALGVTEYSLPDAITKLTPIGVKFVIEKWKRNGKIYTTAALVYQSVDQLRNREYLSLENPPKVYYLDFEGLKKNSDGLFEPGVLEKRFAEKIRAFDELKAQSAE